MDSATAVETRNQLEYYSPRCAANDVGGAHVPVAPSPPPRDLARETTEHAAASAKFSLQIAAFTSHADADALVKKLKSRKFEARVVPSGKLYRVRVGRFATRAEAVAQQKALKTKKISSFVTDIGRDDR